MKKQIYLDDNERFLIGRIFNCVLDDDKQATILSSVSAEMGCACFCDMIKKLNNRFEALDNIPPE